MDKEEIQKVMELEDVSKIIAALLQNLKPSEEKPNADTHLIVSTKKDSDAPSIYDRTDFLYDGKVKNYSFFIRYQSKDNVLPQGVLLKWYIQINDDNKNESISEKISKPWKVKLEAEKEESNIPLGFFKSKNINYSLAKSGKGMVIMPNNNNTLPKLSLNPKEVKISLNPKPEIDSPSAVSINIIAWLTDSKGNLLPGHKIASHTIHTPPEKIIPHDAEKRRNDHVRKIQDVEIKKLSALDPDDGDFWNKKKKAEALENIVKEFIEIEKIMPDVTLRGIIRDNIKTTTELISFLKNMKGSRKSKGIVSKKIIYINEIINAINKQFGK